MNYSIFDGKILFDYSEIELLKEHFLYKFLVEFKLEKFEIIETRSSKLNLTKIESEQKVVIHDLIKDEFYKIYYGMYRNRISRNDVFYNNAYFPTNRITTYLTDDWWILKSTRVPGEDIYNFLLGKSKMIFSMDEFLDAMLNTIKFFNDEAQRIFKGEGIITGKYCSIGEVDWISSNNMFYCSKTNVFTKVDHEPNIAFVDKDRYMSDAIRSFIALFGSLMNLRAHKHIMDYIADGRKILKRIEYCIDFVETNIFK